MYSRIFSCDIEPLQHIQHIKHTQCNLCNTLQNVTKYCNTLQHTATLFMSRRIPTYIWSFDVPYVKPLQHTAKHCNTLPHAATHCNTLQNYLRAEGF